MQRQRFAEHQLRMEGEQHDMQVKEIMTSDVRMAEPEMSLTDAAVIMRDQDIGVVPVQQNDRLVGMVTDRDIVVRGLANGGGSKVAVKDVMSPKILYCYDDQTLDEAATYMGDNQVRRLPVVNRDKRLVGMVSIGDMSVGGDTQQAGQVLEQVSRPTS